MFRWLFLCFLLFSSPVHADVLLEEMFNLLLKTPWMKSPVELPDRGAYRIEPYAIAYYGELQGYELRAFVRDKGPLRLKLFTYTEPSLTSTSEIMLMGLIQGQTKTDAEAETLQNEMAACLKNREYVRSAPDSIARKIASMDLMNNIITLGKGKQNSIAYCFYDGRENGWIVRTMTYHSRFTEFSNKWIIRWPGKWDSMHVMPGKLIDELEKENITQIISPKRWEKIKRVSSTRYYSFLSTENKIPIAELISIYETFEKYASPEGKKPALLLFRNYLARYLFNNGFGKEITPEQKKWLGVHGLEYTLSNIAGEYVYNQTLLWNIPKKYPDSYWGQFAFLELVKWGFDTSGVCRNDHDQWTRVLKEGEAFLKTYPDSPFASGIQFYMGIAAETLFNLGIVEDHPARETSGLDRKQFASQSETARKQAIAYYETVLRSSQKEAYADHLKYLLPRLRAGFATGCEYYFCFYD
ncbi:MAG: tol-pal system YbgF family protein [Candidatus Latescibacterota bacterium]